MQVLQNLATYPDAGQIVADQLLTPAQQEQLEQHILRPADVICALNFSVFLLSSRWGLVPTFNRFPAKFVYHIIVIEFPRTPHKRDPSTHVYLTALWRRHECE